MLNEKQPIYVDFKYLKKFYSNFFSSKYSDLPELRQKLFKSPEDYNDVKDDFKFKIINKKLTYNLLTLFPIISINYLYDYVMPYLTMKTIITKKLKIIPLILIGISSYKLVSLIKLDISDVINLNSKFGIYYTLENAYRNHLFTLNNELDELMIHQYDTFIKSKFKNKDRLELYLFYHDLKTHYMYMNLIKDYMITINGDRFFNFLDKYKYGNDKKGLLSGFIKSTSQEYNKLLMSKNAKLREKIEDPILTKENLINNFSHIDLGFLHYEETLKTLFIKQFKLKNEINK